MGIQEVEVDDLHEAALGFTGQILFSRAGWHTGIVFEFGFYAKLFRRLSGPGSKGVLRVGGRRRCPFPVTRAFG
jgi:hypothetical protein